MAGYLRAAVAWLAVVSAGTSTIAAQAATAHAAAAARLAATAHAAAAARLAATAHAAAAARLAAAPVGQELRAGRDAQSRAGGHGRYVILASPALNERSAPHLDAATIGTLPYGAAVSVSCQASGALVGRSVVWDRLTSGAYISDYWVSTPGYDTWTPGIPRCASTSPVASTGRTVSYNKGGAGECTWWAIEEFHDYSGMYPDLYDPANNGNAKYWAADAAANGWTVTSRPQADSIAVFPPGANGAEFAGHVAWVAEDSGSRITISEMNGPAGWDLVDTRTLVPARSVRYILTP